MLIKVIGDGHRIVIPIPNALIFNPIAAKIIVSSAKKEHKASHTASFEKKLGDEESACEDGELADIDEAEDGSEPAVIHMEKETQNGRSEFHMNFDMKNANGEFPFTEKQVNAIIRELRKGKKCLNGLPMVEVVSSNGENVEIWL